MSRHRRESLALRREALVARAALQRVEFVAAVDRVRQRAQTARGIGPLAFRVVRSLAAGYGGSSSLPARPLALSAGWLLVRALRASPTVRWVAGAVAVGGAVWWVTRSLRTGRTRREDDRDVSTADGRATDAGDTGTRQVDRREAGPGEGRMEGDDASG